MWQLNLKARETATIFAAALAAILAAGICGAAPAAAQAANALADCPARQKVLRIATVSGDDTFSSHPAETSFSSTDYARLVFPPLFGVDPLETKIDASYGVAQSWEFLPGAKGIRIKLRQGLTFNDGTTITAEDVAFSVALTASKFADFQISGALRAIGAKAAVTDDRTVEITFSKGSPTFDLEMSPLVFPLYVTSKAYHSNGEISQEAFDKFRAAPQGAGPYRIVARQAQQAITLEAARKDPLLGCPLYDRIEFRNVVETATRMNQLRAGQQDIISGSRDLVTQAKNAGLSIFSRPDSSVVGFYFFQTDLPNNVFSKEELRKAAAYAIDTKLLAETIFSGIGVKEWGCTWPPPTEISMRNPRYKQACGTPYPYDPEKAKSLLAAAGYRQGAGPAVRLEYSGSYPEEGTLAEAMQPMLDAVGFKTAIDRVDLAERNRRRHNGGHANALLFFGPGGRVTALAGVLSVYGPDEGWGPKQDQDVVAAIARASGAGSLEEYTDAMADIGALVHDRAYGPGFFSAGALYFARQGIPDWGLDKSNGRALLNLAALVTRR